VKYDLFDVADACDLHRRPTPVLNRERANFAGIRSRRAAHAAKLETPGEFPASMALAGHFLDAGVRHA